MSYLTLSEAANYLKVNYGYDLTAANLLRAGVQGVLVLCAPFSSGAMYNATTHQEEDFRATLLVIPPLFLLEIETEGSATVEAAISLDAKTMYFPYRKRTLDQLRVKVVHLEKFASLLVDAPRPEHEDVSSNTESQGVRPVSRSAAQDAAILAALRSQGFDPLALPPFERGKRGVKSSIRETLGNDGIWAGSTVFNKAWDRLLKNGEIRYEEK